MKKTVFTAALCFSGVTVVLAQDIPQSQVPAVIVNSFQRTFPKASDVEWELKNDQYKVEFETGFPGYDHDAWYDKAGMLIRHKEEIGRDELPEKVKAKISSDYSGYRMDDLKRITENNRVTYTLELKRSSEEWKLVFDKDGNVISKVAD